ncbi:interferon-induced very large GTPase 1-like [Pimephales promelas]|nr:interferon-induced very large GTPase 1-like [Pimephales promelas]
MSKDLQAAGFGLEHIMREIGQIYESCSSVKKNKKDLPFDFSSLPSLAAEMMISGFPLELMDGDAAHVPVIWISAVLDKLIQKLGDQRVFVLSVLGIQSSGKSTMLNAMFGLQFAVSAGRCTRGAFMQLVKVSDEMKTQMNFDYILVVDTEGLRALELAGRSIQHHDNELATFVVGLGNLTLINIFGENPSEMQDILQIVGQAFLRMKKVRLNPSCVFVHQNISDVTAGEKIMEGRRRLQEKLDEMTKLAAEEEVCDAECFSDVIRFDIQNDVKYFAQLWEGNPPMAPPNPNYCENIQELKKTIMSYPSKSHGMMLIDLKDRIKDLWEALLKERFVFSFRNSLEISAYRKLETKYSKWSWSLHCAMMEIENKLHNKIENEAIHEVEETDLQKELKKTSEEVEKSIQSEQIHPMDVQMAVFHCADGFLKQLMVTKLSQCQYALPLLVPDPDTQQIEFPLWTFRQINKSWKMRNTNNEIISQTHPVYKAQTPMVSFFRFGSVSSSKSQLMNSLINEKHNTFFHRNCPGSSRTRVLMDGVVEIAWFCPSGKNTDKFTDCVAFCNLHGDAGDHEKQLQILTEMASVNVVLLPQLQKNDRSARIMQESSSTFRLEDLSKHSDIRVDEEDDEDCRRGRELAQQMMSLLEKKELTEIKDSFLPHQGKLWHQWSQKNKELHRPRSDELEMDIRRKQTDMNKIRKQQHEFDIKKHELEKLKSEQAELERISEDLQAASFGLEHIMREIGQIYESCSSVKKNKKDLQFDFSSLPSLAAEMMISGFPLELMDGDAAHIPVIWISAVLDKLIQKLGDQRVFVLSVLGIQSSGKSTMLNAMFGLEFAVSAGRCTRGAFMQLVKLSDEMKTQMKFDYILVVDTEGLRALELAGRSTRHHDNELATFVVGLANLTLINIFGENPSEMQDILQIIVQAFLRMKTVNLNPSCVFVHQNVSDVTVRERNKEGRRRLQETLDEMTKLTAEEEIYDAECFSDVIKFDVQNDVKYFSQLWEGNPPMAPPNPNYCENIQELKKTIMSHASKSHGTMLIDLKDRIKDLWEALLKERFVFSFRNSLEISAYRKLKTKYSKWSWSLRSAMMEIEKKIHNKIENEAIHEVEENDLQKELKKTSEEVEKSMFKFFEKDKDKDILIQWKTSFEIKIKGFQENIVRGTNKKLNEILLQQQKQKKNTDGMTHYENTLYEKSDDIALQAKDKTDDEETLKKDDEYVSKHSDIRVDEEDDDDCRRGREAAQQMMSLLEKKDLREIKDSFLPHQGKLWHQWSQKNKELHRSQAYETEKDISRKQTQMHEIRQQQHESEISEFIKIFIKQMNLHTQRENEFFIKWLGILLDEHTSADLSEQIKAEQAELERISEDLQAASFGLEHIMREIGQIYESCSSVKKNKKDLPFDFSSLPSLAAEMMISGFPLELMDGDAAHVPVIWISAVLDKLIQKLGDQRVFVLSVLGLQSSGKSTMLNAMFGLEFAVSAGRCTRGAFMQLVKVSDEMKTQMNFDYILVVDTEGLRALELAGRSTRHHDNELATFVVGLANLTLINISGENPSEMQDILQIVVQAFLRMKKVRLNPSCVFVHQNVSDIMAGEKIMEGRRRLQEIMDEMTKLTAKDEVCDAECFSDIIIFDIQNDVKYFAHLWEGNPPMAPPNPNYCENIQELKKTIMSHASKSHGTMLIDLKDRIKDLWEALLKERFVFSFRNSLEISAYRKLETEYSKWSWSLRSAMMETENKLHNKIENEAIHEVEETDLQTELKKTSEEVEKSMSEFFEKDKDKDILIQWKTSFEMKIKELQENIVRETKKKLSVILQQRDLKKKIDAQRKHHENALYEKSKELPLKLKDKAQDEEHLKKKSDAERTHHEHTLYKKSKEIALKLKEKANDEETMKKEFDLFWDQSVKKIITDTLPIKDIDLMRDARDILSDVNEGHLSVDHNKDDSEYINIFTVSSYNEYISFKKSTKRSPLKGAYRKFKKKIGHSRTLSREKEAQIKSLVTDVDQQTDKMIESFNISKMGYNISYIKQITDYIKERVTEHQEGSEKYEFKNEFFVDLVLSICKRANETITDQHRKYKEAIYVQKREEQYSIFQKYCHGATSTAIFGELVCQKLKEPIEQSVYKKTARDLTDEMRSNCESLKGNRSNLEKHILKTLAEEEDFDKYMNYIKTPRDHFKSFIRDEVSRYITDKFSVSVLPKMEKNIKLLQQKIMKAAHESTDHVQVNRGDVGLWLKSFTQQLSDVLIFSEKDLSGVKHDDVEDFSFLEDVMKKELPAIMSDIYCKFNTEAFPVNLDYKFRPDELLIGHFCQCCWVQCPFCGAVCTNTIENHDGDHSVSFHRNIGLNRINYRNTSNLSTHICTSAVASKTLYFHPNDSDDLVLCRDYRTAGEVYANWSITPDLSELPYWKWFVCRFQKDLEKYYNKTFEGEEEIPDGWRKYSKLDAIASLEKCI